MCRETENLLRAQSIVGQQIRARRITLKVLAHDTDIHINSLTGYFPADKDAKPVKLSAGALIALCGKLPDDLLNLLMPDTHQIVPVAEDVDLDALAVSARAFLDRKDAAHHPRSPAGREISDCEGEELTALATNLRAVS